MRRLIDPKYMAFPFRIDEDGAKVSARQEHIREQILQVLFTNPGERVFRPHFGGGLRQIIFEPNSPRLSDMVKKRLVSSLTDALHGEVDPSTLEVEVIAEDEYLNLKISYQLATIGTAESHTIALKTEAT